MIEYNTDYNLEITAQRAEEQGIPWIVTSLGARHQQRDVKDYREVYGNSGQAMFLADRNGIVLKTRSDGVSPAMCALLKPHFSDQSAIIDEVAAEIKAVDDEQEKRQEEARRNRETAEDATDSPESRLQKVLSSLAYLGDSEGIANTMRRQLAEMILKSPNLSQDARMRVATRKMEAIQSPGFIELKRNPNQRPELVFAELLQYLEKMKEEFRGTVYYHNFYLFTRLQVLHSMREHLEHADNPVEYAQEIADQYIAFAQEHMPDVMNTGGAYNLRFFAVFFQEDLEKIDVKHSTQLLASFLGQVIPIFESSPDLETQQYARQLSGAERRGSLIGQELEFEVILIDGSKIDVQDLRGKIVLVNFWATTCGPCLAEFPNMKKLYEKYKPLGYEMIAYSCGDDDETLKAFVEKEQHPWLVGSLLMSRRNGIKDYNQFYGIRGIPTTFLLDRQGIVRYMQVGTNDEALNREVEKLFAE